MSRSEKGSAMKERKEGIWSRKGEEEEEDL